MITTFLVQSYNKKTTCTDSDRFDFGFSKEEWFRNSAPRQVPEQTSAMFTASSSAAVLAAASAAALVYHRALPQPPPLLN
ncbi:hypothetical protein C1H46_035082 [Malus baccata]|uniref:Uncharacterized protein n=1 Tax=Malus baccata TaxID=106549 RepID=A0A540KYU2_MALBA|nr:hypothetical protein C1H46_035082 [Malus baccata]